MTIGPNPLGRENQRLIYLHFFHGDNFSSGMCRAFIVPLIMYSVKGQLAGCYMAAKTYHSRSATKGELLLFFLV